MKTTKPSSLFCKFDNGSRINWVFNSGLKISVSVGVLGAVGVVFASKFRRYLDFSILDQDTDSPRVWVVPGLQNLGNNCFLNVVLQVKIDYLMLFMWCVKGSFYRAILCGDEFLNDVVCCIMLGGCFAG